MTERTPSTPAGRDFLGVDALSEPTRDGTWDAILAIEAEARADALREVGELRAALQEALNLVWGPGNGTTHRSRSIEEWQRLYHLFAAALSQPPAPDPSVT